MIPRERHLTALEDRLKQFPVVGLIGARQVGKTTLAGALAARHPGPTTHFDLERYEDLALLEEPFVTLQDLRGLVVIDEVQRRPELFPTLRVLADRREVGTRFLILGSASPELLRQSSESLAGRISYYELPGLQLEEIASSKIDALWSRGGFPSSFLAPDETSSLRWRVDFIRAFLERDIPSFGIRVPSATLHRFWQMLAHYHAQRLNSAELARAFGVSSTAIRNYLDILTSALVVRQLQPWYENISKRQVKAPKVYIADSGILHALLRIDDQDALLRHPKVGASWEGLVIDQLLGILQVEWRDAYFWATHGGAELDLLVHRGGRRVGFEVKRSTSIGPTKSMHAAVDELSLDELVVIHAGIKGLRIADRIRTVPFSRLIEDLSHLGSE